MKNKKERFLGLFVATVLLYITGCSPVYRTTYEYVSPDDPGQKMCTMQCTNVHSMCLQMEGMQSQHRQHQLDYEYDNCLRSGGYCIRQTASADQTKCESDYRRCFVTCGGRATPHTVCVKNC